MPYDINPELDDLLSWVRFETCRFIMGSDETLGELDDDEGPTRHVTIGSLIISSTPVTVAAFTAFVDATAHETDAERAGTGFRARSAERTVEDGLTWRSDSPDPKLPVTQVSWVDAFEFSRWAGGRLATEAEWERCARDDQWATQFLTDQLEWTADYYDATFHRTEQRVNPAGPNSGSHRVARGEGSASRRTPLLPDMSSTDLTFRLVATGR